MSTYHQTASFYRAALLLGIVPGQRVVQWADDVLTRDAAPPADFTDLAVIAPTNLTGLRRALHPLAQRTESPSVVQALLDVVGRDWRELRRDLASTVTVLGQICRFLNMPVGLRRYVDALVDGHLLASANVTGDVTRVGAAVGQFLDRFAGAEARLLEGYRYGVVTCERSREAAALVAALSRWIDSPGAASGIQRDAPLDVWVDASAGDDSCVLYLSPAALLAAESAFSPVPVAAQVSHDALPRLATLVLDGPRQAMGVTDVERRLTHV